MKSFALIFNHKRPEVLENISVYLALCAHEDNPYSLSAHLASVKLRLDGGQNPCLVITVSNGKIIRSTWNGTWPGVLHARAWSFPSVKEDTVIDFETAQGKDAWMRLIDELSSDPDLASINHKYVGHPIASKPLPLP